MNTQLEALILAGGHSTDLRPLTLDRPKHLLPIANRAALAHLISSLKRSGLTRIGVTVNGDEGAYRKVLGDGSGFGVELSYLQEEAPLGTAGCLRAALSRSADGLLVVSGNILLSGDLSDLLKAHRESGAAVTVAVVPRTPSTAQRPQRDVIRIGDNGVLLDYQVHYGNGAAERRWQPIGIYQLDRRALERIPEGVYYDLKEQLLPDLLKSGLPLLVRPLRGHVRELNTAEDYLAAHFDILRSREGVPGPGEEIAEGIWVEGSIDLAPDALLIPPITIGPGTRIGSGAHLVGPLSIGRDSVVEPGARIRESVIGEGSHIGARSRLERCLVADGARVDDEADLRETLISDTRFSIGDLNLVERDMRLTTTALPLRRYVAARLHCCIYRFMKRSFDLTAAVLGLVLGLPIMALVALAIRIDSRGPIFYRQRRCGMNGTEFLMWKFRSMVVGAHDMQRNLRRHNESDGPMFKIADDPRFTRVGRFLRRYSLDELPQLFNLLVGEMSVVGPRPLAREELRWCPSWMETRLRVKPGLTGLWQVHARENHAFQEWIKNDLYYVRRQSFLLDLRITLWTVLALAKGL